MSLASRGLVLGAVGVLVLSACGSPSDATNPPEGGGDAGVVNLVLSNHPWSRGITPLIPEFTAKTGIKVNVEQFAEQQARDKILLNLQSRSNAMDVYMTLPSREGVQFSKAGYYQNLGEFTPESSFNMDDFSPGAMAAMSQNDQLIALPINVEGPALYYRTDVFQKLGLQAPKTVEDLIEVSRTIKEKGDGIIPITIRGAAMAVNYTFAPFFHGEGLEWTTDGAPNFDQPGAAKAIDFYATLARDYGPPGVVNYSFTESSNLFAQGKVAMSYESTNELNSVIDPKVSTVIDNIGVVSVPAGTVAHVPSVLSWGIAMSPYAANKDNAWKFLQWATSSEVQLKLATDAQIAPPRGSVTQDAAYQATLDTETKKQWQVALDDLQANGNAEIGPVGVDAPAMRKVIGDGVGTVILGEATPEEAAAAIQAGLVPLLAKG